MQKMTIAAAVLGISMAGTALAQSVTLYGRVDTGLQYQSVEIDNIGKATRTGIHSGGQAGNRWGLTGSEDLGNGLKAIFTLEAGFNLENGSAADKNRTAFNRQAFAGLSSDKWGTLTLGRQYNFGFNYFANIGPFGNNYALAAQPVTFSTAMVRYDNLLKYATPSFGGFKAGIGFSKDSGLGGGSPWEVKDPVTGETTGDDTIAALTAGIRYDNGPIAFTADFDQLTKAPDADGSGTGSIKSWILGGSYDFNVVKLSLAYGQDRGGRVYAVGTNINALGDVVPVPNARHIDGFKARNYEVGLGAPLAGGTLMAAWLMSDSNLVYAVGTYMKNPSYIAGANSQEYRIGVHHMF
jgi:predicted porin